MGRAWEQRELAPASELELELAWEQQPGQRLNRPPYRALMELGAEVVVEGVAVEVLMQPVLHSW
jgi:hypothetical protein